MYGISGVESLVFDNKLLLTDSCGEAASAGHAGALWSETFNVVDVSDMIVVSTLLVS